MDQLIQPLSTSSSILEPHQRLSAEAACPLTVATHVRDLRDVITAHNLHHAPLIGHSWGAMLALAYAAEHPEDANPIALIGCGTFDQASRDRMKAAIDERLTPEQRRELDAIAADTTIDDNERMRRRATIHVAIGRVDTPESPPVPPCDATGNRDTWADMIRLQQDGTYPAAFECIRAPVLMLHGRQDPHPGAMTRDTLRAHIPHLEYHEFDRCGHEPWLERHAHDEFFGVLTAWLRSHSD